MGVEDHWAFTDEEVAYILKQPLARVATVSDEGQPDVVPLVFEFDDLNAVRPWTPRNLRVYGRAEFVHPDGLEGAPRIMKITPRVSWSMNLDGSWHPGSATTPMPREVEHSPL